MKRLITPLLIILTLSLWAVTPAIAQGEVPYVIRTTKPIATELRGWLDAWLAVDPPSDARYYIVTYTELRGNETLVSLAGVNIETPESDWTLEDETTVWIGTVVVSAVGDVTPFQSAQARHGGGLLLMPSLAAGGGSYVAFPFAAGSVAQYGPRAVHGAGDYGTSGMLAVDLVGGDGMGASSMPPYVYASDAGTIDYICDDGISVAVRTHNTTTGDYFVYAHMLDNASLVMDAEFAQGEMIGSLKYGTFDDSCGWASQHSTQYHVHWMFVPASGKYQVGSCILTISTKTWKCGDETIPVGGNLVGGGGFATPGETDGSTGTGAGSAVNDPTFWDYMLTGVLSVADRGIIRLLPSHQPFQFTYMLFNVVEIVMRLAWVLVESNVNLYPIVNVIVFGIGVKVFFGIIWLISFLFKAWKSLVPVLGA